MGFTRIGVIALGVVVQVGCGVQIGDEEDEPPGLDCDPTESDEALEANATATALLDALPLDVIVAPEWVDGRPATLRLTFTPAEATVTWVQYPTGCPDADQYIVALTGHVSASDGLLDEPFATTVRVEADAASRWSAEVPFAELEGLLAPEDYLAEGWGDHDVGVSRLELTGLLGPGSAHQGSIDLVGQYPGEPGNVDRVTLASWAED